MIENFKIFVVKDVQILAQKTFILVPHKDILGTVTTLPIPAIKYVIYLEANVLLNISPELVSVVQSCCVPHNDETFKSLDQEKMEQVFDKMMELQEEMVSEKSKSRSIFPKFLEN